jgi:tRNA A-37 threonylcarbamoyl transferase component Bud32
MSLQFPNIGELFEGRYLIESKVGSGGFARIYHAVQRDLDRDIALKILKPKPFEDLDAKKREMYEGQIVKRFRREARNVAQLRDPHTITLFDYGQTPAGLFYMVFEFVDGQTLKFAAKQEQTLSATRVVGILQKILSSLYEAHRLGMLHRDIKPANIMLYEYVGRPDQVKVLDFGISKAVLEDANVTIQNLTRDDMMMGTPRYMSPEQLRGDQIGPASDIYSLGLVIYELLTGHKAIEQNSTVQIINEQISPDSIALPPEVRAPRNLRATINRMLAKKPTARFQSVEELQHALTAWNSRQEFDWTAKWAGDAANPPSMGGGETGDRAPTMRGSDFERIVGTGGWGGEGGQEAQPGTPPPSEQESDEQPVPVMPVVYGAFAFAIISPIVAYFIFAGGPDRRPPPPPDSQQRAAEQQNTAGEDRTRQLTIRTKPSGAEVSIDDRRIGESPVDIPQSDVDYPATIYAELPDGRRLARTVERQRRRVTLDFALVSPPKEKEEEEGDKEEQPAESDRGGRPSQKRDRSGDEQPKRREPPADEEPAGSEDEGGSDLPALDAPEEAGDSNDEDYPALDL